MQNVLTKIGVVAMALSMFTLSSCDELKDLLKFDFDLEGEAVYIDVEAPIEAGNVEELGSEIYDRSLADILKEEVPSADINKIKEVNLTSVTLEIQNASDATTHSFQNLESISAEISAQGMDARVVGSVAQTPSTATNKLTIPITGGQINVKDFISKAAFKYAVKGKVKEAINKDFTIKVTANYSFVFGL